MFGQNNNEERQQLISGARGQGFPTVIVQGPDGDDNAPLPLHNALGTLNSSGRASLESMPPNRGSPNSISLHRLVLQVRQWLEDQNDTEHLVAEWDSMVATLDLLLENKQIDEGAYRGKLLDVIDVLDHYVFRDRPKVATAAQRRLSRFGAFFVTVRTTVFQFALSVMFLGVIIVVNAVKLRRVILEEAAGMRSKYQSTEQRKRHGGVDGDDRGGRKLQGALFRMKDSALRFVIEHRNALLSEEFFTYVYSWSTMEEDPSRGEEQNIRRSDIIGAAAAPDSRARFCSVGDVWLAITIGVSLQIAMLGAVTVPYYSDNLVDKIGIPFTYFVYVSCAAVVARAAQGTIRTGHMTRAPRMALMRLKYQRVVPPVYDCFARRYDRASQLHCAVAQRDDPTRQLFGFGIAAAVTSLIIPMIRGEYGGIDLSPSVSVNNHLSAIQRWWSWLSWVSLHYVAFASYAQLVHNFQYRRRCLERFDLLASRSVVRDGGRQRLPELNMLLDQHMSAWMKVREVLIADFASQGTVFCTVAVPMMALAMISLLAAACLLLAERLGLWTVPVGRDHTVFVTTMVEYLAYAGGIVSIIVYNVVLVNRRIVGHRPAIVDLEFDLRFLAMDLQREVDELKTAQSQAPDVVPGNLEMHAGGRLPHRSVTEVFDASEQQQGAQQFAAHVVPQPVMSAKSQEPSAFMPQSDMAIGIHTMFGPSAKHLGPDVRLALVEATSTMLSALNSYMTVCDVRPRVMGMTVDQLTWFVLIVGLIGANVGFFVVYDAICEPGGL